MRRDCQNVPSVRSTGGFLAARRWQTNCKSLRHCIGVQRCTMQIDPARGNPKHAIVLKAMGQAARGGASLASVRHGQCLLLRQGAHACRALGKFGCLEAPTENKSITDNFAIFNRVGAA